MKKEPVSILLRGCLGRMGRAVADAAAVSDGEYIIAAGTDVVSGSADFPVYKSLDDVREHTDVIVDFSNHAFTEELLAFAADRKIPSVIATTGQTPDEMLAIHRASEFVPVFYSRNMSLGVNLLIDLARRAAKIARGFDIEIIEEHHSAKLDAPSGTALMIAEAVEKELNAAPDYVYDRHLSHKARDKNEIGIHSVRGGTIVGEHEVIFAGRNETLRIRHSAQSREVFASGALAAAGFIKNKAPGFYTMQELVRDEG